MILATTAGSMVLDDSYCASVKSDRNIAVSVAAGATVCTRTPISAPSRANARPSIFNPAFAAAYAAKPGKGSWAALDDTFTTTPPPCFRQTGQSRRQNKYAADRFTSTVARH